MLLIVLSYNTISTVCYKIINLTFCRFLIFLFTEWQPLHNERQLVKVIGPIVEIQEQYTLPNDIDQHAFSKFTNIYFKVNSKFITSSDIIRRVVYLCRNCNVFDVKTVFSPTIFSRTRGE